MLEFLKAYLVDIIVVLVAVTGLAYLYFKGQKGFVRNVVINLVREAEEVLGAKTGGLKYAYVVTEVYRRLPRIVTLFISEKYLDKLIEDGVYILKDYLDNGYLDNSYPYDK